ncbi:MAG TPA: ComF family protein [Xanthomonadales bacterium]
MTCQPENILQVDRRWWQQALDVLLPPRCVLCGQPSGPVCICAGCRADLPWHGPHCLRCGLPLGSAHDKICGACIQKPPPFMRTVCPLQYEFPANRLVQAFKYKRQLAAGRVLSHLLCEYVSVQQQQPPDILIPVPLHNLRMLKRGFNQAYEMASYAGRVLDIPVLNDALRRRRNTQAQSGLSRKQRRKNLQGAFYWHGRARPGRHVVLIDDVMTTGTTLTECARVLRKAGAKRVDVWVAARAVPANRRGGAAMFSQNQPARPSAHGHTTGR